MTLSDFFGYEVSKNEFLTTYVCAAIAVQLAAIIVLIMYVPEIWFFLVFCLLVPTIFLAMFLYSNVYYKRKTRK